MAHTNTPAQTALDFCREVLCIAYEPDSFDHTDLNAVMAEVRRWRDRTQEALDEYVAVTLSCVSGEFIGHAFVGRGQPTTATASDPCEALMAACLAAARHLKDA